jgi:hypothetical protein
MSVPPDASIPPVLSAIADALGGRGLAPARVRERAGSDARIEVAARRYVAQAKAVAEPRADRVIGQLSQAWLQAVAQAKRSGDAPMAVIHVPRLPRALVEKVGRFHADVVPDAHWVLVDDAGAVCAWGEGLEAASRPAAQRVAVRMGRVAAAPSPAGDLFSDLHQWMLKVLLAPDLPPGLLAAPRAAYATATALAGAADVSVMSASRFLRQLQREGFLEAGPEGVVLVRRAALLERWRAAVGARASAPWPMRFVLPGREAAQLARFVQAREGACLAAFAAAERLGLGHVSGMPPRVHVPKGGLSLAALPELVPASAGEAPQLLVGEAPAPKSVARGAVERDGVRVADVLQVWLDCDASTPRGEEQAAHLRRSALARVFGDDKP